MTETLSMISHKNHNLIANEDFVIFLTSKLIIYFIDGFTLKIKSQSIDYLLKRGEHRYWILDLEDGGLTMGYMDKRPSRMQGQFYFSKSCRADMEHGLHIGNEGGVPGTDLALGRCDLTWG